MTALKQKELVFISHATPEDNDFTLWISTRLKLMGYQVWSDVTQLFGGEKWWEDIEQAIDEYSCKFVLVITRHSLSKPGVQREVELALAAEISHDLKNFIIPIIIDDSSFVGLPFGLSERNIISFSQGWGPALGRLVERLCRDGVPTGAVSGDLGRKLSELSTPIMRIEKQSDLVISNWVEVTSLPAFLNFLRIPGDPKSWSKYFTDQSYPWFEWGGMLVSFAESESFEKCLPDYLGVTSDLRLDLSDVLKKRERNHEAFLRGEVIKKMNYLIAEAWNLKMRSHGLHRYELSSGKVAWFFPDNEDFNGFKSFADVFGVARKKKVIGFSAKNNVFWHYAIELKAQYGPHAKVCLIPHVVFTEDGRNPLNDKNKMHRLRRGFCKNWWNDRWRDLLLLYMFMLSEGNDTIDLPVGANQFLKLVSRPDLFESEVSLIDTSVPVTLIEAVDDIDFDVKIEVDEG